MAIGKTNASMGAALNFDVKAYSNEDELKAATPFENTIGIVSGNKITSWIFSATEPADPIEGIVWISIGTSSTIEFNALKKNGIQVYPLSAKQYISGAWVNVTAKSYQGGSWVSWTAYLFNEGNEYTDLTGGWISNIPPSRSDHSGTYNRKSTTMEACTVTGKSYINVITSNKIDLTNYNTLRFNVASRQRSGEAGFFLAVFNDDLLDSSSVAQINNDYVMTGHNYIDISAVKGSYYVGFGVWGYSGQASVEVSEVSVA